LSSSITKRTNKCQPFKEGLDWTGVW